MTDFEHVRYAVDDGIATLTLHRPDRLNAVNSAMLREVLEALDAADGDDMVRALIVTGAGRAFCAGADLGAGGQTFDAVARGRASSVEDHEDGGGIVTLRLFDMSKPVIAAINGAAVGFGATFTLPMDMRIASAVSVALARHMLWKMLGAEHPMEAHRLDSRAMAWTGRSADAYEGVSAFLEKRAPLFPLRVSADMPPFFPWWVPRHFAPPSPQGKRE